MSPGDDRGAPREESAAKLVATTASSIAPHADIFGLTREQSVLLHRWIADANDIRRERFALVAVVETINGHYRRRVFLSLDAAQRALERAEARGLSARVVLAELVPVGGERA